MINEVIYSHISNFFFILVENITVVSIKATQVNTISSWKWPNYLSKDQSGSNLTGDTNRAFERLLGHIPEVIVKGSHRPQHGWQRLVSTDWPDPKGWSESVNCVTIADRKTFRSEVRQTWPGHIPEGDSI